MRRTDVRGSNGCYGGITREDRGGKREADTRQQTRVRTLNRELRTIFKRWYPDMDLAGEEMPVAI
jgi:hypothetical protein